MRKFGSPLSGIGSPFGRRSRTSVPPTPAVPVVSGVMISPASGGVGDVFNASGSVSGYPAPAIAYQWLLDGDVIDGATSANYTAIAVGILTVTLTATNSEGSDNATSAGVTVSAAEIGIGSMAIGSTFQVAA